MDEAARQRSAAGGFWAHSLQVYAQPGVEPACLRLQDEAGLDPNLLLLALYAGGIGRDASELLRKVKAAQYVRSHPGEVCPAKWEEGEKTLAPSLDLVGKI